jgi:hypothetical protein
MTDERTPTRKALDIANGMLKGKDWWSGKICTDKLPSTDEKVLERGISKVASDIVSDTMYWELGY